MTKKWRSELSKNPRGIIVTGIVEVLKSDDIFDVRLTCGNRWMTWDNLNREWVVREKKYRQRGVSEVYRGRDEHDSVNILIGD